MPKTRPKRRSNPSSLSKRNSKPAKKAARTIARRAARKIDTRHFRSVLSEMRDEAVHEIDTLSESMMPEVVALGEQPEELTGSVQTVLMIDRQRKLLNALESALQRIDKGTFGRCRSCGESIDEGRLEALPYTELCVNCR